MNKIVVIGVAVVAMVAVIATILLLLNHPNSNSSLNSVVTPTMSTTTTTTSTSVNTSSNLQMNSLYFINENSSGYYYIFVLNLTSYKEFMQLYSVPENSKIISIGIQNEYMTPIQIIEKGEYLFIIGRAMSNISLIPGDSYPVSFGISNGAIYSTQVTYEGTWAGSIP